VGQIRQMLTYFVSACLFSYVLHLTFPVEYPSYNVYEEDIVEGSTGFDEEVSSLEQKGPTVAEKAAIESSWDST